MKNRKLLLSVIISSLLPASGIAANTYDHFQLQNIPNQKSSGAMDVSADGKTIVGNVWFGNSNENSAIWKEQEYIVFGTFNGVDDSSLGNKSYALAISNDGQTVVGSAYIPSDLPEAEVTHVVSRAYIWHASDKQMIDLGSLRQDNSGSSSATAISADGKTVVGNSSTDYVGEYSYNTHAFIWHEGDKKITDIGSLTKDGQGYASASGVSENGEVVVGYSNTDSGNTNAFIWHNNGKGMESLGTLKADNSGNSWAYAISDDGSTIVGSAESDDGSCPAVLWHSADKSIVNLGTLKDTNKGFGNANAVSADGSVVVGYADTNNGDSHAFIWHEGDKKLTDLGTLKQDNSGQSYARGISADGSVVVGSSDTDEGRSHAAVWKVKQPVKPEQPTKPEQPVKPEQPTKPEQPVKPEQPTKPEQPSKPAQPSKPVITIVDATNSAAAMMNTGNRSFEVLDLYKRSIQQLADARCQLGMEEYCLGAFSQYDTVTSNHRVATGVFGSMRLPVENIIIGGAINFANNTQLTDNYAANGKSRPGVGAFIRYQQNRNNDGLSVDLSGAFLSQGVTITRDRLSNTEAGKGDSDIKGYQATLSAEYGIKVNEEFRVSPTVALTHRSIKRDGYTENRGAEFAATYGKIKERRTELDFGVNSDVAFTPAVSVDAQAGATVKLNSERDAFTGYIPYIGSFVQYGKHERNVEPYVAVGVNIAATKNSVVRTSVAWQQTDYYNDAVSVGLNYSYRW